jgi:ribosomal protein L24E
MRRGGLFIGGLVGLVLMIVAGVPAGAAVTAPGRPRNVSISTSDHRADIYWTQPASNGGAPITGYRLTWEYGSTDVGTSPHARLSLFENGATYHVRIAAMNGTAVGPAATADVVPKPNGYWMLDQIGDVYSFGQLRVGVVQGASHGAYVHIESSHSGNAFWTVTSTGSVDVPGASQPGLGSDAIRSYGGSSLPALLPGESVVSLSRVDSEQAVCNCSTYIYESYWLFTSRGRVLPFGRAKSYGDLSHAALNQPIIGSIPTPTGKGYYMVAADGGVFSFGDAKFHGSTGSLRLNAPVTGLVPNAGNTGYWLVASDGGIFAFNAPFRGSMGGKHLNRPINGMVRFGNGYLMVASDGGVFDFSNKRFYGSLAGTALPAPIVSIAASG